MSWLFKSNWVASPRNPANADLDNIALDIKAWGGNVDAGANSLVNMAGLILNSGAKVGIGTATPSDLLHLKAVTPTLILENTSGGYTRKAKINTYNNLLCLGEYAVSDILAVDLVNQRVGIGTTNPSTTLDVNGPVVARSTLQVVSTSNLQGTVTMQTGGTGGKQYFASGTDLHQQMWKDATPTYAMAWGLNSPGNTPTSDLVFSSYNGATWAEKARLTNAGLLGVRCTPTAQFEVSGTSLDPSGATAGIIQQDGSTGVSLLIGSAASSPYASWLQSKAVGGGNYPLALNPLGGGVAIGNTAPNASNVLDVTGTGSNLSGSRYVVASILQDHTNYRGVIFGYDSSGQIGMIGASSSGTGSTLVMALANSGGTWVEAARFIGAGGFVQSLPSSSPGDGSFANNSMMFAWYDESNNRIAFRVKSSAGVLKTGYVTVS